MKKNNALLVLIVSLITHNAWARVIEKAKCQSSSNREAVSVGIHSLMGKATLVLTGNKSKTLMFPIVNNEIDFFNSNPPQELRSRAIVSVENGKLVALQALLNNDPYNSLAFMGVLNGQSMKLILGSKFKTALGFRSEEFSCEIK